MIKNIIPLCVMMVLLIGGKSFAMDDENHSSALIGGINRTLDVADQAMKAFYKAQETLSEKSSEEERYNLQDLGYPDGYDPDDPVAMGEVDPRDAYYEQQAEDMDRAMAEEAQGAWQEQYEPQPDFSDFPW